MGRCARHFWLFCCFEVFQIVLFGEAVKLDQVRWGRVWLRWPLGSWDLKVVPIAPCWLLIALHNSVVQSFTTADNVIVEDPGRKSSHIASQSFLPICFLSCLHEKPLALKRLRTDIKHCMTQQQKPTSTPKWKKRSSVSLHQASQHKW